MLVHVHEEFTVKKRLGGVLRDPYIMLGGLCSVSSDHEYLFYLSTFLIKGNHLTQSFKKLNIRFGDVLVSQEVLLTFPLFEQDFMFCRSLFGRP